jgi:hypothetical protein
MWQKMNDDAARDVYAADAAELDSKGKPFRVCPLAFS